MKKNIEGFESTSTTFEEVNETTSQEVNTSLSPITMDNDDNFIVELTSRQTSFCSLKAETQEEKALLYKAMNNPEKRVGDCINMKIYAKDLYCEVVKCVNRETLEVQTCPRIVIIDKDGVGYQAVSMGVFSAIKKIIQVFGTPSWAEPLPLVVKQITKGEKKLLTFDVEF